MAYMAKDDSAQQVQLKVQSMVLPFYITANATPASKTVAVDFPQVLHLKVEGIDYTTVANGGFGTSAEAAAITFATSADATGIFSALIRVGEQISKVVSVRCIRRNGTEFLAGTTPTGSTTYITSLGDKIVVNIDTAINFATTDFDAALEVQYIVAD